MPGHDASTDITSLSCPGYGLVAGSITSLPEPTKSATFAHGPRVRNVGSSGEKFKLMLMKGGATKLGGESQRTGVLALAELLRAART